MFKVLLIDAQYYCLMGERFSDLESILPPVGLMYIANYLKHKLKNNIDVRIINRLADCVSEKDLVRILKDYNPDIVGIRGMIVLSKYFHETAKTIKKFKQDMVVVGGGPYVTMDLQCAMEDKNLDYCVIGEGEITFSEIVERILNNQEPKDVKGIAYRDGKRIIMNEPRPYIEDLDSLPYPDYNLISVEKYGRFIGPGFIRRRQASIFSSRGCSYHCIYCNNIMGKRIRLRSAENVFGEIEALHKNFKINDFYFSDDCFNYDYKRAMDIFDLVIKNRMKINIYFPFGIRGDIIDPPFIDKMVQAGVIFVSYSAETASPRLQKLIKKFLNLDKLAENIHYSCKKDIMVSCHAMVGFPTETKEEVLQTIEYLKQFKKTTLFHYHTLRYYPGTEIYNLALTCDIRLSQIKSANEKPFHDITYTGTPLLSKKDFLDFNLKVTWEILLSKERLRNAIKIQEKFLTKQEILDAYSIIFKKRVSDLERDVLSYAR